MNIRQLDSHDKDSVKELFLSPKYMGPSNIQDFYLNPFVQEDQNMQYYHNFVNTYLSDLSSYTALGAWVDHRLVGLISAYCSTDEPSWYGTQIRSTGHKKIVQNLLDAMIEFQESRNRFKFYTLWSRNNTKLLRRFAFSVRTHERYDYFDEYYVPAKHRCFYTNHWHILFNRVLLPVDTVIRCTFLKQQYRAELSKGGGL